MRPRIQLQLSLPKRLAFFLILNISFLGKLCAKVPDEILQEGKRYSLNDFIKAAENEGPSLTEARAKISFSEARERGAAAKAWPAATLETLVGPVPGATGNPLVGATDWDRWGVAVLSKLEIVQPIYTFGALGAARRAAGEGTRAEKELYEKERWKLRSEIAQLYYAYQLAFEFAELSAEIKKKLEGAQKVRGEMKLSPSDSIRFSSTLAELKIYEMEAEKSLHQLRSAMGWKLGIKESPRWDQANLTLRDVKLGEWQRYQSLVREKRPELKALHSDTEAKKALAEVEEGLLYPSLFAAARVQHGWSPVREAQTSPFAYDQTNYFSAAAGLGLKWNFGFLEGRANYAKARAEFLQAEARERFYSQGIMVELEKNYRDLKQAQESYQIRLDVAQSAKKLLNDAFVAYKMGSLKGKDLLETLGGFGLAERSRLEALYKVNHTSFVFEQSLGAEF